MENETELNEPELIRQQMFETRTALTEKLETLEEQVTAKVKDTTESVVETVDAVKEAVESTVHTVSDSVHDTVESVKESLNVSRHVEEHPWAMLGGAVLLGFVAERMLNRSAGAPSYTSSGPNEANWSSGTPLQEPRRESSGPSWGSTLLEALTPAMVKLGGLAVGATTGVIGELIHDSVPEPMRNQVDEILDGVTVALGGTPIHPHRKVTPSSTYEEASSREYHQNNL